MLQEQGSVYIGVGENGREKTMNAGAWTDFLSVREMLTVVRYADVLRHVQNNPYEGLRWISAATPWGNRPTPLNFRFGDPRSYRDIKRIVERKLNISLRNRHPYYQTRAGRNLRRHRFSRHF